MITDFKNLIVVTKTFVEFSKLNPNNFNNDERFGYNVCFFLIIKNVTLLLVHTVGNMANYVLIAEKINCRRIDNNFRLLQHILYCMVTIFHCIT